MRRPPAESLLLALGLRPGAAADRLLAAQRAGREVGLDVLDLRPLDRAAAEPLLAGIPVAAERERRFAQSGGNPLLLIELSLDGGAHALPGGIVNAVRAEVGALALDAQALARGAALAGDPFELDLAAAVAGLEADAALAALDELERHALVRATEQPRTFAFRHPVIRTAIYEGLGAGARLAGHAAAARALAARRRPSAHATSPTPPHPATPARRPPSAPPPQSSAPRRPASPRTGSSRPAAQTRRQPTTSRWPAR